MNNSVTYQTKSAEETQKIAGDLAKTLPGGTILALYGDLGAGKTTFTQGLAQIFGIEKVISPTFIILRTYEAKNQQLPIKHFYHIDLYRTETEHDIEGLGLSEIFQQSDGLVVIEWPEKMGNMLPEKRIDIKFELVNENERKITIDQNF